MNDAVQKIVSHIRRADNKQVILGPIRQGTDNTTLAGSWYFIVVTGDPVTDVRLDAVQSEERELTEELRIEVMRGLFGGKPIVIHDMDDELAMMRMAEVLWPSERATTLREHVEQEMGGS